jgi:translation initiation factor 2 alpha subunit (eIF-2alpha)
MLWLSGVLKAEFIKDIIPVFCMNYSVIASIIFVQKKVENLDLNSRRIPTTKTNNEIHTFKTFNGTLCILSA